MDYWQKINKDLAELAFRETGFDGDLRLDATKPDDTRLKCLDVTRINNLGWHAKIGMRASELHLRGMSVRLRGKN